MQFSQDEKTALFIDGANLYSASRHLGFDIDYRNLLQFFRARTNIVRAYYYSALLDNEEYSPLRPLTDWLAYNGYSLVTKAAREFTDGSGRRRVKGNMDVELAVDMLELAPPNRPRHPLQRRQRFPPPRRGRPAHGRPRLRRLLRPHHPPHGRRRAAPAGRPVPRTGRDRARVHPPRRGHTPPRLRLPPEPLDAAEAG